MKKAIACFLSACGNNTNSAEISSEVERLDIQSDIDGSGSSGQEKNSSVGDDIEASLVYFTSDISPEGLMAVYEALDWEPTGKAAVKLSTGEPPVSNYLAPELIKDLVQSVGATIVECNTAYGGSWTETAMHMQVAEDHGFTAIADVDILDAEGSMELPVEGGTHLKNNLVGSHFGNYDSYIVFVPFQRSRDGRLWRGNQKYFHRAWF